MKRTGDHRRNSCKNEKERRESVRITERQEVLILVKPPRSCSLIHPRVYNCGKPDNISSYGASTI